MDDRKQDEKWTLLGNASSKLRSWQGKGATIVYLSSKTRIDNLEKVRVALREGGAPAGELFFRTNDEHYGQVARRALPDVIVEDDCKSIGGEKETTWTKLPAELRKKVRSVVVPEFGGIDHLPDDPTELAGG